MIEYILNLIFIISISLIDLNKSINMLTACHHVFSSISNRYRNVIWFCNKKIKNACVLIIITNAINF